MNLQLYNVDSINYLVDFHHKKSYRASSRPGAGKFDMARPHPIDVLEPSSSPPTSSSMPNGKIAGKHDTRSGDSLWLSIKDEDVVVSPYVFMDIACKLILELAGGG
jgi:carbon catabolite-derepressing protein kinase